MLNKSLNTSDRLHIPTHFSFFIFFFRSFFVFLELRADLFGIEEQAGFCCGKERKVMEFWMDVRYFMDYWEF
jgi:hypothetical protein